MTPEEIARKKAEIRARLAGEQPAPEPEQGPPFSFPIADFGGKLALSRSAGRIDIRAPKFNTISVACPNCGTVISWAFSPTGAYSVNALNADCDCGAHVVMDRLGVRAE